ncbi:unnamed protein product, partial [Tenebrio molitor]
LARSIRAASGNRHFSNDPANPSPAITQPWFQDFQERLRANTTHCPWRCRTSQTPKTCDCRGRWRCFPRTHQTCQVCN